MKRPPLSTSLCPFTTRGRTNEMQQCQVTPHVGVWIETTILARWSDRSMSLPMWECGLKHCVCLTGDLKIKSLPMWECGLKPHSVGKRRRLCRVTPHVGVWIETPMLLPILAIARSHSLCGSVDWNYDEAESGTKLIVSLPMWECGLKLPSPH